MPLFNSSDELCAFVREKYGNGYVMLSFSGKDSVAAFIQLSKFWDKRKIIPVHGYLVPHLRHIDEEIHDYEEMMGVHIYQLPHPFLYLALNTLVFQPPERIPIIEKLRLPQYDWDDLFAVVVNELGLPEDTYVAVGVTQYDSQNRWSSIQKRGAMNEERMTFYPIYDWNLDRIVTAIRDRGWHLHEQYRFYGRSLDGIDFRFLDPMRKYYPDDYARIVEWFPFAELELLRMDWRKEYYLYAS